MSPENEALLPALDVFAEFLVEPLTEYLRGEDPEDIKVLGLKILEYISQYRSPIELQLNALLAEYENDDEMTDDVFNARAAEIWGSASK